MISRLDLQSLVEKHAAAGGPVLSLHLDVDQSSMQNLNRGFETRARRMLRSFEEGLPQERERKSFGLDAGRALEFLAEYAPDASSLVIFCSAFQEYFWSRGFRVKLPEGVRWEQTPYVRPLVEAIDEYERYAVVLADQSRARLFTVFLGEIEEHEQAFGSGKVRRIRAPGSDHLLSQTQIQRKAREHARWHLKETAEQLSRMAGQNAFDRIVLAGPLTAAKELQHLLDKGLGPRVAASVPMSVEARDAEVLDAVLRIEKHVERAEEMKVVEGLLPAAAKNGNAVTGLTGTLACLEQGRVWRLVYAEGFAASGWQCANCAALFDRASKSCSYCGEALGKVQDLLERMVERVLETGGRIEQVRGEAGALLRGAGGIGAVLRFQRKAAEPQR
ncbi:MAG: hypothetical protein AB1640_20140 [bacterium]